VITVRAGGGSYDVHCRWGALEDLGRLMRQAGLDGVASVIADETTARLHGAAGLASLRAAGFEPDIYAIPPGEPSKSLDTMRGVYDWLVDRRAERGSPVVALGGGVAGDLAGFAAATYLRGVPFVQAPTTLLAMVDASVGGKTGVDHARGKNLIGAFYPPRLVVADTSLLATLPPRALRDGFAEAIKHALIRDPALLDALEREADALLKLDPQRITELVERNVAIKAAVVSEDEREGGLRMILNYGHTTAHAIEAVTGYGRVMHGEADSAGMMVAAEIGRRHGVTPAHVGERQARVFARYGLPLRIPGTDVDRVMEAMAHDKKVSGRRLRWILLEDVGRPVVRDDVPPDLVRDVLQEFLS
jgi:3-dehydroquinate synthase